MIRNIFLIVSLTLSSFFWGQLAMSSVESKAFVAKLSQESKKTKTLQSDFIQTKKVNFLTKPIVTSGKMAFQSPNTLSWQYTQPYRYSVIFKGGKIYINDKGKKSSIDAKSKMFEKISQLMMGSANGNLFSDPDFNTTFYQEGAMNIARLKPQAAQLQKYIQQVELYFRNGSSTVSKVVLIEKSGDATQIEFSNTQVNATIPTSLFNH